jgi:hypothetical protein
LFFFAAYKNDRVAAVTPHHQFVIATPILVVAAPSFFHRVAPFCEVLLYESLCKKKTRNTTWLLA